MKTLLATACFSVLFVTYLTAPASAEEIIKIVLWNGKTLFDVNTVNGRAGDFQAFGAHYSDADLIILDEVTSLSVVNAVRDQMGFTGFATACSDFNQNDNATFNSLEVGLISKFPLEDVVEYDLTPDNSGAPGEPEEERLERVDIDGIADDVSPSRGFLTARIPALGLTIVGTHLKSSGGGVESDNAKKREFVAAAMAKFVAEKLAASSGATVIVAGDMNVGETDLTKNGFHLGEDNDDRADGDLYDDTHAIFGTGIVDGLHMASLTKGLGSETYDDTQFAGSGPIDCIYVVGEQTGDFTLATKSPSTFGSDHFAVSTRFLFSGTVPPDDPSPPAGGVRIAAILPNPANSDIGNEWVELRNVGTSDVNLAGWKLRDEANNSVNLSGTVSAGDVLRVELEAGEMPLNNGGDEIELINPAGDSVHFVLYSAAEAVSGQIISF